MFGEQGVPQNVYERYFKIFYVEKNKQKDDEENLSADSLNKTSSEDETTDLESSTQKQVPQSRAKQTKDVCYASEEISNALKLFEDINYRPRNQSNFNSESGITESYQFCEKCDLKVSKYMYHCEDCQVCTSENDHHCIFYSKCIAKGNTFSFYAAIVNLVINFCILGFSVIMYG